MVGGYSAVLKEPNVNMVEIDASTARFTEFAVIRFMDIFNITLFLVIFFHDPD